VHVVHIIEALMDYCVLIWCVKTNNVQANSGR